MNDHGTDTRKLSTTGEDCSGINHKVLEIVQDDRVNTQWQMWFEKLSLHISSFHASLIEVKKAKSTDSA